MPEGKRRSNKAVVDAECYFEDDDCVEDAFDEEALEEAIDETRHKSHEVRLASLQYINKCLSSKYISHYIHERAETLCDVAEHSLRKHNGEEQVLGAILAALLCTQLGPQDEAVYRALKPALTRLLADNSAPLAVRQQCAASLGLCCFISCTDDEDIESTMDSLYSLFSRSLCKGNGIPPKVEPEICSLHLSALLGWNLLLTGLSPSYAMDLCDTHLRKLPQLLESPDVDLRIAAGETLAILYEVARLCREDFEGHDIDSLCEKLEELAADSKKYRSKKDRKLQRSSFRKILQTIESREGLDIKIRVGDEEFYLLNWCHKRQYDAFCHVLGSGMNLHLKQNEHLRDIFELGEPILDAETDPETSKTGPNNSKTDPENSKLGHKSSKRIRQFARLAAFKDRTKGLRNLRDKRADVISTFEE